MDYLVRCHLAPSIQQSNDVERAQSFVADAVCDGGALDWEHKKMFEGLAGDEIQSLTVQETENLEVDQMKFNAFRKSVRKFLFGWKVLISWGLFEKICDKRGWRTVLL